MAINTQEFPANGVDSGETSRESRRMLLAILGLIAGWALFVTIAARAIIAVVDTTALKPNQVNELFLTMKVHGALAALSLVMWLILRRRPIVHSRWPKIGLLVMVLVFVGSSDRILAVLYPRSSTPPLLTPHPRRGFAHRVSACGRESDCTTCTNRFGFRGRPVPLDEAANEFRVLFLGDSITFGFGLADGQTPVADTGRLLQAAYPDLKIRALNAGVSGYTTWQELDVLRHEGLKARPDLVVLQFCINDVLDVIGVNCRQLKYEDVNFASHCSSSWSGIVRAIHSLTAPTIDRKRADDVLWTQNRIFDRDHPAGIRSLAALDRKPLPPAVQKGWNDCLRNLNAILTICRQRKVPFVLAYSPNRRAITEPENNHTSPAKLASWSKRNDVPFIDLTATYRRAVKRGVEIDDLFLDNLHPRSAGAKLMAQTIADKLIAENLIQ